MSGTCVTAGYFMREHMAENPNLEAFSREEAAVGRMLRTGDASLGLGLGLGLK